MANPILIATIFSFGFFIESIVGFGGTLIAYTILAFFMDLKSMILISLYIGTCSSACIAYTDLKSFDAKVFKSIIPFSLIGIIIGAFIFSKFSTDALALIFGIILIILSLKMLFFEKINFLKNLKNKLILLGGISQGAFSIGGPFIANAIAKECKDKSSLRTTLAIFFFVFNLIRIVQLALEKQLSADFFINIWWMMLPVFIAIRLGYKFHVKTNEKLFKKLIATMTIIAGFKFLAQFFSNF